MELTENFEVKMLAAGANWLRIGSMIALGMSSYYSRLPKGSTVSVHTFHPGRSCIQGLGLVDAGKYHFGITSPSWLAKMAAEGRGDIGYGGRKLALSAVCVLPHRDYLMFVVRRDLGIKSLQDIKDRQMPLKISTGPLHLNHSVGWATDAVLAEYGIKIEDFERWGGSAGDGDRNLNFMKEGPPRGDRVTKIRNGELDGIFDEGIMSRSWKDMADTVDLDFLPIDDAVLNSLERKYGMPRTMLPKGYFRGIDVDTPAVDFAGWMLYCHADLPDDLVYSAMLGLEEQCGQMETLFESQRPHQGLSDMPVDLSTTWQDTHLPLHAGAAAFFRDRGYMS